MYALTAVLANLPAPYKPFPKWTANAPLMQPNALNAEPARAPARSVLSRCKRIALLDIEIPLPHTERGFLLLYMGYKVKEQGDVSLLFVRTNRGVNRKVLGEKK